MSNLHYQSFNSENDGKLKDFISYEINNAKEVLDQPINSLINVLYLLIILFSLLRKIMNLVKYSIISGSNINCLKILMSWMPQSKLIYSLRLIL